MTLGALHQRFLQHCAVEKRLRPITIASYRSDFGLSSNSSAAGRAAGGSAPTRPASAALCKRVSRRIGRCLHPHLFRHTFATELLGSVSPGGR